ncbi:uncharacterized protein FTJAE_11443 [Fusarium tjaetaba]|uniref:Uncharacterized protein n=1 Tax=Fusarium tjaetaba TaxID=1567544 RepID=A0A8H5QTK7_9HYPO|nr:uncharacterized protein FTJAE_11443 [Fusarium tjaetaba]KAF5621102.1 hypothetical protein FTJAE_11443 [Fusarium tjaetaba]
MSDDVITDDFDVEVFLDLLHWSWEDAYNGTREIERPVSPFSQPVSTISEPDAPQTEPQISQPDRESYGEQSLSVDSQVCSSHKDLGPLDMDESFATRRSATPPASPSSCSLSSGQSSPSTVTHDDSPRPLSSNLKRSAGSETDAPVPKRLRRQIRNGLMSVTDAQLNSTAESPKNRKISCDQGLAPFRHDHDSHNSSIADRLGEESDGSCSEDSSERRENPPATEPNVPWKKYR